jgi:hypothetical protein
MGACAGQRGAEHGELRPLYRRQHGTGDNTMASYAAGRMADVREPGGARSGRSEMVTDAGIVFEYSARAQLNRLLAGYLSGA